MTRLRVCNLPFPANFTTVVRVLAVTADESAVLVFVVALATAPLSPPVIHQTFGASRAAFLVFSWDNTTAGVAVDRVVLTAWLRDGTSGQTASYRLAVGTDTFLVDHAIFDISARQNLLTHTLQSLQPYTAYRLDISITLAAGMRAVAHTNITTHAEPLVLTQAPVQVRRPHNTHASFLMSATAPCVWPSPCPD